MHRAIARWKPYSGLIYFHLLFDRLEEAGLVSGQGPHPGETIVSLLVPKTRSDSYTPLNNSSERGHSSFDPSDHWS